MMALHRRLPIKQRWRIWPLSSESPRWALEPGVDLVKVLTDDNKLLLLTGDGHLVSYSQAVHESGDGQSYGQRLFQTGSKILDFCHLTGQGHVLIFESGKAFVCDVKDDQVKYQITNTGLKNWMESRHRKDELEDPVTFGVSVEYCACNSGRKHLVVVDNFHKVWSFGKGPQTGLISEFRHKDEKGPADVVLSRIDFFQGHRIRMVSSGSDFNVALVEHELEDETDLNVQESPMSLSTLSLNSPATIHHQRTSCPLGLPLQEGAIVHAKPKADDLEEDSHDVDDDIKKLTKSGLYLNPNHALKFLSEQLGGVKNQLFGDYEANGSLPVAPEEEPSDKAEDVPDAQPSIVNMAGSFVSSVGQSVVSKLTRSLSTEASKSMEADAATKTHKRNQSSVSQTSVVTESAVPSEKSVFDNEVWVWGKGGRGQVGQGDMLDRLQPCSVPKLSGLGIIKVSCGVGHSLALSVTGRVFGWGDNSKGQACPHCSLAVCPFPQVYKLLAGESASDIATSDDCSFVLCDSGNVYMSSIVDDKKSLVQYLVQDVDCKKLRPRKVMTSSGNTLFVSMADVHVPLAEIKTLEKNYLFRLKDIISKLLIPLCKAQNHDRVPENVRSRDKLVTSAQNLLDHVAKSVQSSWELVTSEQAQHMTLYTDTETMCQLLTTYIKNVCDCLAVDCLAIPSEKSDHVNVVFVNLRKVLSQIVTEMCQDKLIIDRPQFHEQNSSFVLQHLLFYPSDVLYDYVAKLDQIQDHCTTNTEAIIRLKNLTEKTKLRLKTLRKFLDSERKLMRETREFWEMEGERFPGLKNPSRRLILDSLNKPVSLAHASSFSKHRFILLNDALVHKGYAQYDTHPLQTVWIETKQQQKLESEAIGSTAQTATFSKRHTTDHPLSNERHEICLVMPEDTLTLVAHCAETKSIWLSNLQRCISGVLKLEKKRRQQQLCSDEPDSSVPCEGVPSSPPIIRNTAYTFKKGNGTLKNSEYTGAWVQAKIHGYGTIRWLDGSRFYTGQLKQNKKHGPGRMECFDPKTGQSTVYDGNWKNDQLDGNGSISYPNGDVYKGMLKNGQPHGQGVFKQGKLMGSGASVYTGEFQGGLKHGYGVLDDIVTGEKYMGMWANDLKSGAGCVITLDGVYYEGHFLNGKMVGRGLAIFEDNAVYEGNFADAGIFSGQGVLSYSSGDSMVGYFDGTYTDGMRFNGTIYKAMTSQTTVQPGVMNPVPSDVIKSEKIGAYSVAANKKWQTVFQTYKSMIFPPQRDTKRFAASEAWELLAIQINQNKNANLMQEKAAQMSSKSILEDDVQSTSFQSSIMSCSVQEIGTLSTIEALEGLEMIPEYDVIEMTIDHFKHITAYLDKAFRSPFHPFSNLLSTICDCYTATYGVGAHPRLLTHAVQELAAIVEQIYNMLSTLFPALPSYPSHLELDCPEDAFDRHISATSVVYPYILPKIHPSIFMLYALHCKKTDDEYWARILKWNRHTDVALLAFLEVDEKFWFLESTFKNGAESGLPSRNQVRDAHFGEAVETLQQIKTKFTPFEKINVIVETFRQINKTGSVIDGKEHFWSMDELFPVFQYIMVRARIPQLGAEILMIEDLIMKVEEYLSKGEYGIWFTTMQACYYQILKEPLTMS